MKQIDFVLPKKNYPRMENQHNSFYIIPEPSQWIKKTEVLYTGVGALMAREKRMRIKTDE